VQQSLLAVIALGVQLVSPILALRMLDLFPHARGSAASVQSCVAIIISAVVFGILVPLLSSSLLTLAEGSLCAALLSCGLWRSAQHRVSLAPRPS
jgi:DHA1 family bicyclomycin/chloramphenicol resistance-like MFS transporter